MAVNRSCRAKAARTRAQKQPRAGVGDCAQAAPMGERRTSCAGWCRESTALGARRGRGHTRRKNSPRRGWELCADCAHGETAGNGRYLVPGRHRTGRPPGQRACLSTKNSPRRGPGTVRRLRPRGKGGNGRYLVAESDLTGCPPGQRAYPAQKQPPAGAGGCLDTGYGCYLPRAIRVIWMHRVGSTARPRIMPS